MSTWMDCSSARPRSQLVAEQVSVIGQSDRFKGARKRVLRTIPGSLRSNCPLTVTLLRLQTIVGTGTPFSSIYKIVCTF